MNSFHSYTYKQRSFLILLPLMLLAICTWALNPHVSPHLDYNTRGILMLAARIFLPGIFVIAVAFVFPTFDRLLQIVVVSTTYILAILLIPEHETHMLFNPIICVITAISSLLALLPLGRLDNSYHQSNRIISRLFYIFAIPALSLLMVLLVIRQIDMFIIFTFDEIFGNHFLSVIYVPLYLILQTVGLQDLVGDLITNEYQSNFINAFINAIIITNLFSLPATIFTRSLFAKKHARLFLTIMMLVCILTNSIGVCTSIFLLITLIFYIGSFSTLLISSMICFGISYVMYIPPITSVSNLYLPDVNLSLTKLSFNSSQINVLEMFAIFIPVCFILISMLIRKDRNYTRKQKLRAINIGYTLSPQTDLELQLIALLKGLGGVSNILDVAQDGNWIYIQVLDLHEVILSNIKPLSNEKILVDRVNKLYLCDMGDNATFFTHRLKLFINSPYSQTQYNVQMSTPFEIKPMPHTCRH